MSWSTAASSGGAADGLFRYGWQQGKQERYLTLYLDPNGADRTPPQIALDVPDTVARCESVQWDGTQKKFAVRLRILPATAPDSDDRVSLKLSSPTDPTVPVCQVDIRRTCCKIETSLLGSRNEPFVLAPLAEAALFWYACDRFTELVGLKQFLTGLSGSQVLVFQPRLLDPDKGAKGRLSPSWGSCLLVKTGSAADLRREADCFTKYLTDRLHPFMARSESFLILNAPDPEEYPAQGNKKQPQKAEGSGVPQPEGPQAILISSFLGGQQLEIEPLELLLRGNTEEAACRQDVHRLFELLGGWYGGSKTEYLSGWTSMYDSATGTLAGKFDLRRREDREAYAGGLDWDVNFVSANHLRSHLVGKNDADGLLARLAKTIEVRFSLIHGDLNPRNVLASREHVWLIDFSETGVAPTLYDFAKLEVFLRLWCLDVAPETTAFEEGAQNFEWLLLQLFLGTESSLAALPAQAAQLGVAHADLRRVAVCIAEVRKQAMPYLSGRPDRADYLAVLFLTVLQTLQYARKEKGRHWNYQMLMALYWLLESVLSRHVGLEPYLRPRRPMDARRLLAADWLEVPRAPARVRYFLEREDGGKALPMLAALRGVLQNRFHHLDCFDHTLLVLADLERLLAAPWEALVNPGAFEVQVADDLKDQGFLEWPVLRERTAGGQPDLEVVLPYEAEVRALLTGPEGVLSPRGEGPNVLRPRLVLKWVALLHDVGKPATRGLNQTGDGRLRVQCLGHEAYSAGLVEDLLGQLFGAEEAQLARRLIKYHELPHRLLDVCLKNKEVQALKETLRTGDYARGSFLERQLLVYLDPAEFRRTRLEQHQISLPQGKQAELSDEELALLQRSLGRDGLVLLILHGYADRAACCGSESTETLDQLVECYLVILALAARYPWIKHRKAQIKQLDQLILEVERELNLPSPNRGPLRKGLQTWVRELAELENVGKEQLIAQANAILSRSSDPNPG